MVCERLLSVLYLRERLMGGHHVSMHATWAAGGRSPRCVDVGAVFNEEPDDELVAA